MAIKTSLKLKGMKDTYATIFSKVLDIMDRRDVEATRTMHEKDITIANLEDNLAKAKEDIRASRKNYETLLSKIPTAEAISELVSGALVAHSTKESILALTDQCSETTTETASYSQIASKPPVLYTSNKRTLIVKGRNLTPGRQLETLLAKEKVSTKIQSLATKRNHVEINCNTEMDMKKLQRELQSNQNLNKHRNFLQKAPVTNKMILLGAPSSFSADELSAIVADKYGVQ